MTAAAEPGRPRLVRTSAELSTARSEALAAAGPGSEVAVVMTMGALHAGHVSLLRLARARAAVVIATIFVNPLQFGPREDFGRYPRSLDADLAACGREAVDVVFAPSVEEVYPDGEPLVRVCAGRLGGVLEGVSRPGHFDGVLTVVAKLLHITAPDAAVFGQKDAQQILLVRRMVRDLDLPVEVLAGPTVREPDGLALSSRNRYLTADERDTALALSAALRAGAARAGDGPAAVRGAARRVLDAAAAAEPPLTLDYCALVDPSTLEEVGDGHHGEALLALAGRVGATRLIDNTTVVLGGR